MKGKTIKSFIGLGCVILLLAVGIIAVSAQEGQPLVSPSIFLPVVHRAGHTISGQVLSPQNIPISGVMVQTDKGQSAVTDQYGNYSIDNLKGGTYTLSPSLGGIVFSPSSSAVVVPPSVEKLNFTADAQCEAIVNSGFEGNTGWEFPATEYPASYDTSQAHSGNRSARTGITNPADNRYSYSSTRQRISIPSGATSANLSFWIKPYSDEAMARSLPDEPAIGSLWQEVQMAGDVQYALILNTSGAILQQLIWQKSDSRTWTEYHFNLLAYRGQTIYIHIGTYNDGYNGVSSMFVDDVSLELCAGGTPPPPPGPCSNLFKNPSFEWTGDWEIPYTAYPAGYSSARAHTGARSMRTGITYTGDNRYSYSDFRQAVHIPSGAAVAMARFWLYTLSGETSTLSQPEMITPTGRPFEETTLSGDVQYVLVLDQYQNWIDTLVWQRTNEGYWHFYEFDLRPYSGRTIYLQFGTYNDGYYGISSMFVDDVSLDDCGTPPTPPPGPCTELLVNNNFDGNTGWEIPVTVYPAGFSNAQYHSAFRAMRTGIVVSGVNLLSYSDFRQRVSIPYNTNSTTLRMWIYPISGEMLGQALPPQPTPGSSFGETQMTGDIQYLLVMDTSYNIVEVLMWRLSDSQTWTNLVFDLSKYRGWTLLLQWGTYNDGGGGTSAMYVDDVTLQACH
ncbi:MAG: hypothetical protein A2Z71_10825 [Chloroflexi bacterium RBG_13_50_21]|nr:MAG: hypothetical protein A2Z71_10825 [Chloroflexi bacterium RBG_13_50_21]